MLSNHYEMCVENFLLHHQNFHVRTFGEVSVKVQFES
jgi:hypothetical protein